MTIKEGAEESTFGLLDERFLQTPSFAVEQCMTLATNMAYMVKRALPWHRNVLQSIQSR